MSSFISIIRNTHFRNLWLGQVVSQIAVNMFAFILIIQIYSQTRLNVAVSFVSLAIGLPAIVMGVVAGGIVDALDKKSVLVWCNFFRILIFSFFLFFFPVPVWVMYTLASLFSIVTQFFIPAEAPSIPNFVSKNELLPANSLFTFSLYVATVIGFIISGPLLLRLGPEGVYLFMAALMFVAMSFSLFLPSIRSKNMPVFSFSLRSIADDIIEGVSFISKNIRIKQSLLLMTFSQALLTTLAVLAPGFADRTLHIALEEVSYIVMGPAAIGLIFGALWVGTYGRRILKRILVVLGILGTGITLLLLSFLVRVSNTQTFQYRLGDLPLGGLEVAIAILFFLGFTNALISVPASVVLQEATEGRLRGRVYGVLTSLTGGAAILPVVFSGILADSIGITRTLLVLGFMVLSFGVYRLILLNQVEISARIR